jgi:uncharacterized damage-inducible protein DinB
MTTAVPATSSIRQTALGDFEQEMAQTRRILERVPDDRFDWKPHAKSGALGQLAAHVASLPRLALTILETEGLDFAARPPKPPQVPADRDGLLHAFDEQVAAVRAALGAATDEALGATWTLRNGEHVIVTGTRASLFRTMGLSHLIHHRGQLSVYLRLLDVPLPGMYGPSADER